MRAPKVASSIGANHGPLSNRNGSKNPSAQVLSPFLGCRSWGGLVVFLLRWAVTGTRMSQSVATCEPRRHKHASFKMNWVICKICACVSWTNGNILRLLCLPMRLSHAMPQALMGPSKRHPSRPNGCNHNHCYKLSPTSCIERLGSSLWPSEWPSLQHCPTSFPCAVQKAVEGWQVSVSTKCVGAFRPCNQRLLASSPHFQFNVFD